MTSRSEGLLADGPKVRVWDLPTRLFHWLLLAGVTTSFITVKLGGNAMIWHGRAGTFVLSLLVFRVLWGFIGSPTARFANFVKGPKAIWLYLRGVSPKHLTLGHNPLGALSVVALLGLFLFQALTGLGTSDDIFFDGPLVQTLSSDTVSLLTSLHKSTEPFLLGLIALHLAAIAFYRLVKKTNLVRPMITGAKRFQTQPGGPNSFGEPDPKKLGITEGPGLWLKALVCWLVSLAIVTNLG
ncbi:MAG: cytochrome b/b6 domain-containing protein [Burkholderiaceae bacterium]